MNIKAAYDWRDVSKRERVSISFLDEDGDPLRYGKTDQSFKTTCDILNIILRYDNSGLITHVNSAIAEYGDYTEVNEYQEAMNLVSHANESFEEIPSDIRKRFGNDAGLFFEFATNPANADELVKLGLANPPAPVPVSEPPEAPEA